MQRGAEYPGARGPADVPHCLHADMRGRGEGPRSLPGTVTQSLCRVVLIQYVGTIGVGVGVQIPDLGTRYFFPGLLIAKPLLFVHGSLSLKRYFF